MAPERDADVRTALRMSWSSLLRQKLLVGLCLAAAVAAALAYLALRGGSYTAMARVLVDNRVLAMAQQDAVYSTSALTPQLVQSQVEILRSENLSRLVIERLSLMWSATDNDLVSAGNAVEQQQQRRALDALKRRLSVEVVGQSHVIEVRYASADPKRAADVVNALLQAYLEDQTTANAAAARSSSGWLRTSMSALGTTARVLTQATAPVQRDGPRPLLVLAFAAFCGLLGGSGIAFVRGLLDRRVRTPSDVASAVGYPPIAVLPLVRRQWRRARPLLTLALSRPKGRFAHGVRRVLATARAGATPGKARVVGVTGLRAVDGASVLAANIARLAAAEGAAVLLVDASRFSGTLTELAKDNDTPADALLVDPWSNLRFASLLHAPEPHAALQRLLEQRASFDLIIVDLPPVEPVADAVAAASLLDGVILAVSAEQGNADELRDAVSGPAVLADKIIGIVLNKAAVARDVRTSKFYIDEGYSVSVPPLAFVTPAQSQQDSKPDSGMPAEPPQPLRDHPPRRNGHVMNRTHGTLAAFLCALLLSALPAVSTPALGEDYRLAAGDKLRLKISEWPDLTGEYTVGAGDALSLPVIGAVAARNLTAPELSAAIAVRLQKHAALAMPPAASVEVIGYRPFFMMGDVQRPGEYPYRPGLTVVQAVSIAGGYYRPQDAMYRLERDSIVARSDIGRAQQDAKRIAARIARLEAEQADRDTIAPPPNFDMEPGGADQALLADEQRILAADKDALQKLLASLDHYRNLYEQEIRAVTEQIATERQQARAVERELDSLKGLAERGLSPLTRQLATERTIAQISGSIQGLQATILRAQQNIGQTEQRRIEAINARAMRVNSGLQAARAEAKEAAQRLQAARELLNEAQVTAPGLHPGARLAAVRTTFTILRASDEGAQEIEVERTARVQPGDVLTVERRLPAGAGQEGSADALPSKPATRAAAQDLPEAR